MGIGYGEKGSRDKKNGLVELRITKKGKTKGGRQITPFERV